MTKPASIQNKPRKQRTPEFRNKTLKFAERIGVAAAQPRNANFTSHIFMPVAVNNSKK